MYVPREMSDLNYSSLPDLAHFMRHCQNPSEVDTLHLTYYVKCLSYCLTCLRHVSGYKNSPNALYPNNLNMQTLGHDFKTESGLLSSKRCIVFSITLFSALDHSGLSVARHLALQNIASLHVSPRICLTGRCKQNIIRLACIFII